MTAQTEGHGRPLLRLQALGKVGGLCVPLRAQQATQRHFQSRNAASRHHTLPQMPKLIPKDGSGSFQSDMS